MRKLLIVLLSIMLLIGLSACSSGNNDKFITVHRASNRITYDENNKEILTPFVETYHINVAHIVSVYDKTFSDGSVHAYIETDSSSVNTVINPDETMEEIMNMIK